MMRGIGMFRFLPVWAIGILALSQMAAVVEPNSVFRVKTQLFTGEKSKLTGESLTLATDGFIYDLSFAIEDPTNPREIVILDLNRQQFVLIDPQRSVKAVVSQDEIAKMLEDLRSQLSRDSELKSLVDDFQVEETDIASGQIKLNSPRLQYTATCEKPKSAEGLTLYFEYLNQFARLNATDPTRMAPFARLRLNSAIQSFGWVPTRIELEIKRTGPFKKTQKLISDHEIVWAISKDDLRLLDSIKTQLIACQPVTLAQYRQWKSPSEVSSRETADR